MTAPVAWIDCSAGIAGDMLLGALLDAGADLERVRDAVRAVDPILDVTVDRTARHGIAAAKATVLDTSTGRAADHPHDHDHSHQHDHHHHDHDGLDEPDQQDSPHEHTRTWRQVRELLERAALDDAVRTIAHGVFARLARAEGGVHGMDPEEVTFHEVGALDAIGDVVGCAQAWCDLGLERAHASVVTLGGGEQVIGQHGRIPLPGPAVLRLAREAGMITTGGPVTMEMTTPTGAALLAELVASYGPMPEMIIDAVGCGAGTRDPHRVANLCRVLIGRPAPEPAEANPPTPAAVVTAVVLETNVDDLDPRLWPAVISALLAAGAADAWTTPILMKKGRPATTLSVLCSPDRRDAMLAIVLEHTTTLGIRETTVAKHVVDRRMDAVTVLGHQIAVKIAERDGRVINVQPEYDDLAAAAAGSGRPVKQIQALATAASVDRWGL